MRTEDLNTLLHQLYKSSDDIRGIIDTIYKLMRLIDVTSLDDGLKIALIPTYENAIRALNDVLNNNQELSQEIRRLIEVLECCSTPPQGLFGQETQVSHRSVDEIKQQDDEAALRRKALADALREGQPVTVSDSNIQVNVSASEDDSSDNDFEGIVVPSGKLAGGVPSHCRVCDNIVFSGAAV